MAAPGPRRAPAGRSSALPAHAAAAVLMAAAGAAYAWIGVFRHEHFGSNAFDLAVQDQTVWGYSRLAVIPNTVEMIPNLLGDHFHPILVVLAPFYRLWDSPDVLLVAQALLLAAAGVPVYVWTRGQLGSVAALLLLPAYLLFWGVLAGVVYDFHHVVFGVAAISFALWAVLTRRNLLLWAMVAVLMATREDLALTLAALGVYLLLAQRRAALGAAIVALSLGWFLLLIRVVMPALAGSPYRHWTYQALGSGPAAAAWHVATHPLASVKLLFTPLKKAEVMAGMLGNWLFLPLLSPIVIVIIPEFLERFWSSQSSFWSFHFDYSMVEAPVLAFAATDTLARARRLLAGRCRLIAPVAAAAVLVAAVGFTVAVRPLAELGTYSSDSRSAQIRSCLEVIPPAAPVTASNALVPHLSHRREIYLITMRPKAEYIAVDPGTYRHFYPGEEAQLRADVRGALGAGYGVACSRGTTIVLRQGVRGGMLSPEARAWLSGG